MQQAHTAETSQPERDERGPARGETSGAGYRTSSDQRGTSEDQRRARPVARATGRAEYQPVRATSALKKGPRAASTGRADTSRRSETSGASCRTSQKLAGPRDKRISHHGRSPRGECAQKEPNFGWRSVRGARRNSRTADSGRPP